MNKALRWSVSMCALAGSLVLGVPGRATAAPPPGAMALAPAFGGRLYGVAVISNRDVWAVGLNGSSALIVHWNGGSWSQSQPTVGYFNGIGASSARDVWAVGGTNWFSPTSTLAEHWNGSSWRQVATPSPAGGGYFNAVAATSPSNAWAVGLAGPGPGVPSPTTPLIEHWNGRDWTIQKVQEPAGGGQFAGVSALSPSNAWAVGWTDSAIQTTLIEHWDGRTWTRVPTPNEGIASFLHGITAVSGNNVWAVGSFQAADGTNRTLALYWNGSHWTVVPSQTPGYLNALLGISAVSRGDIYAVGSTDYSSTLIIHWNGTAWS